MVINFFLTHCCPSMPAIYAVMEIFSIFQVSSPFLSTRLCYLLGLEYPLLQWLLKKFLLVHSDYMLLFGELFC